MGCFIWDTSKWNFKLHQKWHPNVFFCKINKWKRNNVRNDMSVLCGTPKNGTKQYSKPLYMHFSQTPTNEKKHRQTHCTCVLYKVKLKATWFTKCKRIQM